MASFARTKKRGLVSKPIGEISTPHVIVEIELGARDRDRLRFATSLIKSALNGSKQAQKAVCIRVKNSMNSRGGRYNWIEWNPRMLVRFFEDRNELPESSTAVEFPSEEEIAEAKELFGLTEPGTAPIASQNAIVCECVPSSFSS